MYLPIIFVTKHQTHSKHKVNNQTYSETNREGITLKQCMVLTLQWFRGLVMAWRAGLGLSKIFQAFFFFFLKRTKYFWRFEWCFFFFGVPYWCLSTASERQMVRLSFSVLFVTDDVNKLCLFSCSDVESWNIDFSDCFADKFLSLSLSVLWLFFFFVLIGWWTKILNKLRSFLCGMEFLL